MNYIQKMYGDLKTSEVVKKKKKKKLSLNLFSLGACKVLVAAVGISKKKKCKFIQSPLKVLERQGEFFSFCCTPKPLGSQIKR